jgi:hypothetical protein
MCLAPASEKDSIEGSPVLSRIVMRDRSFDATKCPLVYSELVRAMSESLLKLSSGLMVI